MREVIALNLQHFRYLLAGTFNALFGYGLMGALYWGYGGTVHILILASVCNVLSITVSFLTYKIFVFRTKGRWVPEWLKSYVVYGGAALLSIVLLWILVDFAGINILVAQAIVTVIVVFLSYRGHSSYTFKES